MRKRKDKYFAVNANCSDWYTNLSKAIREIKKGYFGKELTYIYSLEGLEDTLDLGQLGFDDLLLEFKDCKLVKDWRHKK